MGTSSFHPANHLYPEGVAYGETYKWIVGATLTQPCAQDKKGTWTCAITRPGGYRALVVWNSIAASSLRLSSPSINLAQPILHHSIEQRQDIADDEEENG